MGDRRLTNHPSFAATRTIGLAPVAAIAPTHSCIAASGFRISQSTEALGLGRAKGLPSMFPCSVSTHIQSTPL